MNKTWSEKVEWWRVEKKAIMKHLLLVFICMLALLLTSPRPSLATIVTIIEKTLIGLAFNSETGGCVPIFRVDFRDIVLQSQQLDNRLGGALAAIGVRAPSSQAFGGSFTGVDTASVPPGWSIIMDSDSLPFTDPTLVTGRFIYFIPPDSIDQPQNLGDFQFHTQLADFDSLIFEVRGKDFVVGESGSLNEFGPIQVNPDLNLIECDSFPDSLAKVTINNIHGLPDPVSVTLSGPTNIEVDIGNVADTDEPGNGLEQVETEIVQMELTGKSDVIGPVTVRLRDSAQQSKGEIEELVNNTPGVLDIPPFTTNGTADSFFNVFFEIEVPNAPPGLTLLHNDETLPDGLPHLEAAITHKPPAAGETYRNPALSVVELLDENNNSTGITIGPFFHIPNAIIQDFFTFEPVKSTFKTTTDTTDLPPGFVAKFSFDARLTNKSDSPPFSDLVVKVRRLTNGNLLHNADGGQGGVKSLLTIPEVDGFSDGVLSPGESVDVHFIISLMELKKFSFFIDVLGALGPDCTLKRNNDGTGILEGSGFDPGSQPVKITNTTDGLEEEIGNVDVGNNGKFRLNISMATMRVLSLDVGDEVTVKVGNKTCKTEVK